MSGRLSVAFGRCCGSLAAHQTSGAEVPGSIRHLPQWSWCAAGSLWNNVENLRVERETYPCGKKRYLKKDRIKRVESHSLGTKYSSSIGIFQHKKEMLKSVSNKMHLKHTDKNTIKRLHNFFPGLICIWWNYIIKCRAGHSTILSQHCDHVFRTQSCL